MNKQLALDVTHVFFDQNRPSSLRDAVFDLEKNTATFVLDGTQQVALTQNFTTVGGMSKLTWVALRQICNCLSPGFYKLITDLCGRSFSKKSDKVTYSNQDALSVYNTVLNRRFSQAVERKLILKNIKTNVIDAVLTQQNNRIPLADFYKAVNPRRKPENGTCYSKDFIFKSADLSDRKLSIKLVPDSKNKEYSFKDLTFKTGIVFTHSEYSDNHTSVGVFVCFDDNKFAIDKAIKADKGTDIEAKVQKLTETVAKRVKAFEGYRLISMLERLEETKLGFTAEFNDNKTHKDTVVKILCKAKLRPKIAERVVTATLVSGLANQSFSALATSSSETWPGKSAFDLFKALLAESVKPIYDKPARDNIEQVLFRLLLGKLKFT